MLRISCLADKIRVLLLKLASLGGTQIVWTGSQHSWSGARTVLGLFQETNWQKVSLGDVWVSHLISNIHWHESLDLWSGSELAGWGATWCKIGVKDKEFCSSFGIYLLGWSNLFFKAFTLWHTYTLISQSVEMREWSLIYQEISYSGPDFTFTLYNRHLELPIPCKQWRTCGT